ncbi:MAG: leucine-rich repeat domain-containing protein [Christensenellales bacterium]|nr:leucine-rich repeat domain-containing protein [Clostridiales bacterium]
MILCAVIIGMAAHPMVEAIMSSMLLPKVKLFMQAYAEHDIYMLASTFYPENSAGYNQFVKNNFNFFAQYPNYDFLAIKNIKALKIYLQKNTIQLLVEFVYKKENLRTDRTFCFLKIDGEWYISEKDTDFFRHVHYLINENYNTIVKESNKEIVTYKVGKRQTVDGLSFYNCKNLIEVTFPSTYMIIKHGWFGTCDNLIAVNIDEDSQFLTSVDGVVYTKDMSVLVYYPKGKIQNAGSVNLGEFKIPEGVKIINSEAFRGCLGLKKIICPSTLKYIYNYAFADMKNLESIVFNDGLQYLYSNVFENCDKLKSVAFPDSMEIIGKECFYNCRQLESAEISAQSALQRISYGAFDGCSALKNIYLPDGMEEIEEWCFQNCYSLKTIRLPQNLKRIGRYAFRRCVSLEELYISRAIQTVEIGAFHTCSNLKLYCQHAQEPPGWSLYWDMGFTNECVWGA